MNNYFPCIILASIEGVIGCIFLLWKCIVGTFGNKNLVNYITGKGEPIRIYDGRRSLAEGQRDPNLAPDLVDEIAPKPGTAKGEIHYLRDSDDEQPDSDEDPDDDLDI